MPLLWFQGSCSPLVEVVRCAALVARPSEDVCTTGVGLTGAMTLCSTSLRVFQGMGGFDVARCAALVVRARADVDTIADDVAVV